MIPRAMFQRCCRSAPHTLLKTENTRRFGTRDLSLHIPLDSFLGHSEYPLSQLVSPHTLFRTGNTHSSLALESLDSPIVSHSLRFLDIDGLFHNYYQLAIRSFICILMSNKSKTPYYPYYKIECSTTNIIKLYMYSTSRYTNNRYHANARNMPSNVGK